MHMGINPMGKLGSHNREKKRERKKRKAEKPENLKATVLLMPGYTNRDITCKSIKKKTFCIQGIAPILCREGNNYSHICCWSIVAGCKSLFTEL